MMDGQKLNKPKLAIVHVVQKDVNLSFAKICLMLKIVNPAFYQHL